MKKMVLAIAMAMASVGFGYYYNSDTLITFNEPITIRVMDVYSSGMHRTISNEVINRMYEQDWIVTNIVDTTGYFNYTKIATDYQLSLDPNIYGYTTYELGKIPTHISFSSGFYTTGINCSRYVGYKVNGKWLDKDGNDLTDMFDSFNFLNNARENQHNSRINPSIQMNSVISMKNDKPSVSFDIVYSGEKIVWGKKTLNDSEWVDVTDEDKSEYKFFKVTLKSL